METYWIYGIHACRELLLQRPESALEMVVLAGRGDERLQEVLALAEKAGLSAGMMDRQKMDELLEGNHQGVAIKAKSAQAKDEQFLKKMLKECSGSEFFLVLDGVTDPHNLGACIRSADAAGVQAVIVPKDNSAPLNATVQKVACGAAETVPLIQVTNLSRSLKKLQEAGVWVSGFAGEAQQDLYQADLKGPIALVMGAEGSGMRRLTREQCDFLLKIPMAGAVSSLNVSVATGIALFEAVRQRQG